MNCIYNTEINKIVGFISKKPDTVKESEVILLVKFNRKPDDDNKYKVIWTPDLNNRKLIQIWEQIPDIEF